MPDWTSSMQQTYEYYTVDPNTWKDVKQIKNIKSASITWDLETDTLSSASLDVSEDIGESYIRVYMITIQNGVKEKHMLGTFLVQTVPTSSDGKSKTISADAYSPLLELNEKYPPIGYYIPKESNIMLYAHNLTQENMRAPVLNASCNDKLYIDYAADPNDTWLAYIKNLMANAKYSFMLDEKGQVLFMPKQEIEALQPVWTYNDDNSSILYPDLDISKDLYGIPNVVEVLASNGGAIYHSIKENNDINSPVSIANRGRRIVHRVTDPEIVGSATQERVDEYAEMLLKELSSMEHTITYTHGYCPVRVGDCIRLNYSKLGLHNVKARVISQSIKCEPGCPVTEKAVFTTKLYGGKQ